MVGVATIQVIAPTSTRSATRMKTRIAGMNTKAERAPDRSPAMISKGSRK